MRGSRCYGDHPSERCRSDPSDHLEARVRDAPRIKPCATSIGTIPITAAKLHREPWGVFLERQRGVVFEDEEERLAG